MDGVGEYYAGLGDREWQRLETPSGWLEFTINSRVLQRHLPRSSRVLDIGGGPGRYACWLAEIGHRVVLADLSPELLAIARERLLASSFPNVEDVVEADARDLSAWREGEFDAALSLGPFYHLTEPADRARAASELHRVVRPGGLVFVAFMPRYTFIRRTAAIPNESHRLGDASFIDGVMGTGVFINDVPGRFTDGYGAVPSEIVPFFQEHGFELVTLVASQGLGSGIEESIARLRDENPVACEHLLTLILESAADPSLHGLSTHLMYVGRRR